MVSPVNLKSSLNFSSQSGCHWHKKEEKHPITCEPHSTIKALNDDTYERVQFIQYTAWRAWMLHGLSRKEWTLTYIKRHLQAWPLRHKRQNHAHIISCTIVVSHVFPVSCNKYQVTICDNRYMKIHPKNQPARTNLDPARFSKLEVSFALVGEKNALFPHILWLPIHLHHSKAIHPAVAGLLSESKKHRNTENSTTLADLKNVKNMQNNGNNGKKCPTARW